eukprot:m.337597 g.337597  ORF g.337597 m.337597 type:complete len:77 (+) comp18173_c0_seq1:602-832(+)
MVNDITRNVLNVKNVIRHSVLVDMRRSMESFIANPILLNFSRAKEIMMKVLGKFNAKGHGLCLELQSTEDQQCNAP